MKTILVLTQRDIYHKKAGGAERYLFNVLKGLSDHYKITCLCQNDGTQKDYEIYDNITFIRIKTNLISLIFKAMFYYKRNKENIDLIIDHTNTHQFFTFLYVPKNKRLLIVHQLALEIWEYYFPKYIGKALKLLEKLLWRLSSGMAVTVSRSTKEDLQRFGFKEEFIWIVKNSLKHKYTSLPHMEKEDFLVSVGRLVPYKRFEDAIYLAKKVNKKIFIIGEGQENYKRKLRNYAKKINADVIFTGYISEEKKQDIVEKAYMHIFPSIREGWGLVISEAANLGTPSLVYPVPGCLDAVNYGKAGFVTKRIGKEHLLERFLTINREEYERMRICAFEFTSQLNYNKQCEEFQQVIQSIIENT
ncbi:glycosyltransferase involved in cell wall bisynthesis [Caldicellulosiruptor bescii]|uniref:Glycosyl transferase group 1 n=3 Tax=Caldicellulosiruptor bescii TaxID=31899 RepID=B9MM76_CALBD|nr:glycosyltransferase family 4 protein [Caldicellulosiruptor bescii]ACM59308.1 glycosyl transferase group 1 [Caldicellulosiruptor bescii DSM 6725]PBC88236.1 glycosyltransferase involved in cell wall bisynthesis [Caldicellulosiruptor bescii]PBC92283.1 glycosyltransferase involved in cell wall bisynthesis [Caldicellulosiruptor bescii]PBD04906.1 glycosyltransferase involved in cell wall bisynthesis [Caldicellulosiruptor bescii]PBD05464.1 glycosyltransferase involved in cell wall bisynthesis [Cal